MELPIYQVDAFADHVFAGNPAAVVPLDRFLRGEVMQYIAAENNLAETAFVVRENEFKIRWFTPTVEVDLCGHATLAAAFVCIEEIGWAKERVEFGSMSGPLAVSRERDLYTLDFPSRPPEAVAVPVGLGEALGSADWSAVQAARELLVVFEDEEQVSNLQPDMARLAEIETFAVMATAPGKDCDFVSRFFAPRQGIPEDPVTGSAHCTLTPYWSARLGKRELHARQISARGGELWCRDLGERVEISGRAVCYMRGTITI